MALLSSLERLGCVKTLCFTQRSGEAGDCPLPPFPGDLERLLSPLPSLLRCFRSSTFRRLVTDEARDCQICFCLGLQMFQYANAVPTGIPVVLDNFNVESEILWGLARRRSGLKRLYWKWQALKLQYFERQALRRASHTVAISGADARRFSQLAADAPISVFPPGLELSALLSLNGQPVADRLVFVGNLEWHINVDCARWFAREVFPLVRAGRPQATFQIVGRRPTPDVKSLSSLPGVSVHADVPEVGPYLQQASAIVVPLRYGSGVQNKVIEGMAAGRPVITSPIGFEGLEMQPGEHLLVADGAESFAAECLRVLKDPLLARQLGQNGRLAAGERFSRERMHRDVAGLLARLGVN